MKYDNVFVLNTGRCGSVTFSKSCGFISNYTTGHETNISRYGNDRLSYPASHIEIDNRLSWFLGRLDAIYGTNAFYVHLVRDRQAVISSFMRRSDFGIFNAYQNGVYLGLDDQRDLQKLAGDYVDTVNDNISLFLKDKPGYMLINIESASNKLEEFWSRIGAIGDMSAAEDALKHAYNAS